MNIIVIMLDSFRTDHMGAYAGDHAKAKTPHIDRFAQEALLFNQAYTGSFPTLPCRRDLFTGRWGHPFHTWNALERAPQTMGGNIPAGRLRDRSDLRHAHVYD